MKSNKRKIIPWQVKGSKLVLRNRWIRVRADECVAADGTVISPYYVLEYPNWVHMVVINDKNQILITEQYRHGAKDISFELPCGTQERDEKPLEAAKRELIEETGYSGVFTFAGRVSPNPATHSNDIYVFLVMDPVKKLRVHDNPTEILNYEFMNIERVYNLIDKGKFRQGLHISSLMLGLRKYQREQGKN